MRGVKIPKHIKIKIYRAARHFEIANKAGEEVRNWMGKNYVFDNHKKYPAAEDIFIDSCELKNNPESFMRFVESGGKEI